MIQNAEVAFRTGTELLSWWKSQLAAASVKTFDLDLPHDPSLKVACFYDTLEWQGKPQSVMGCVWKSRFRLKKGSAAAGDAAPRAGFEMAVKSQFLRRAKWMNLNKLPAGFGFTALQYRLKTGEYGSHADSAEPQVLDLDEIGNKYQWVVYQADVYDFFADFPKIQRSKGRTIPRFPKMASYVLIHEDYLSTFFPPAEGAVAQCVFGYSFLPLAVYKSFLGFGPGRFDAAVKQFRFSLLNTGEVEVQLSFVVSPRSQKVLYLAGFDPVYGIVNLLNALTFGALKIRQRAHDKLDSVFLSQHAKVYQALIDGMHELWEITSWVVPELQESAGGKQ
jgi:hypothetical protein